MERQILVPGGQGTVPAGVTELAAVLRSTTAEMRATEESNGGLKRKALKSVVEARLLGTPIGSSGGGFFPHELDFVLPTQNAAVSVQAGRAWMNNGALLAVLAAAAQPNIEWLLCLVPFTYMNAAQFDPVVAQIEALAVSDGVDLDLRGIIVIAY